MKKLLALVLALVCVLGLTGCSLFFDQELKEEISEIIEESDVQLVTEYYHHLQEVNIEYANGNTRKLQYTYPEAANQFLEDYIGCIVFENGQQVRSEEYVRDENDNIISIISNSETTTFTITYDANSLITQKIVSVDGVEVGQEEYLYNEDGLITEYSVYESNNLVERVVTDYDENGKRTKITRYNGAGNVISYDVCEFDQKTHKEKVSQYDANGELLGYVMNSYDLYGLILVEEAYDASGNLLSKTTRRYENGEITYDAAKGYPGK